MNINKVPQRFGEFGGQFVPETVMNALIELEREFLKARADESFQKDYGYYVNEYSGRPTPLYYAENLTKKLGGGKIYLKREDLNHTGAHKINNVIGSVVGPHPYPTMVRDFQRIIGDEVKEQIIEKEGRLPDYLVACVGGGSNAMGLFYPFHKQEKIKIYGVEAGGMGVDTNQHAATITKGSMGVMHGMMTYLLQDDYGQIMPVHSISSGLDYPGIGPEHAYFHSIGRVGYVAINDDEAVKGFQYLTQTEGIIPALESAHAMGYLMKLAPKTQKDEIIVLNLSGRGAGIKSRNKC